MQTKETLAALVGDCQFKDWNIQLKYHKDSPYIQILFMEKDEFTGVVEEQHCRKWDLNYLMCDTEVIDTVFLAVSRAMQHEVEECFKFRGRRIYNPHRSVHKLWEIAGQSGSVDTRATPAKGPAT